VNNYNGMVHVADSFSNIIIELEMSLNTELKLTKVHFDYPGI